MKSQYFRMSEFGIERERHGKYLAAPCRKTKWIIEDLIVSDGLTGTKCKEQAIEAVIGPSSITIMARQKAIR